MKKNKILVILGPTATGKSDLAVRVALRLGSGQAQKIKGEIISADSRQVYKGLDIGTGKITKREMRGVPHHVLDVVSPMVRQSSPQAHFSVSEWQKLAKEKIAEIISRGHTPIIVGGTGLYIQSIVDDVVFPEVPPNEKLRKRLEKKSAEELLKILKKLDPRRAKNIEQKNPVRLIRAIEIATKLGKVPPLNTTYTRSMRLHKTSIFLQIGLTATPDVLKKRIHTRLLARMKKGMIAEAKRLHTSGLTYTRMRSLGLEYRHLADFLQEKISRSELTEKIYKDNVDYAKRQMTWFKRDERINWFDVGEKKIEKKIIDFLHKKD